MSGLPPSAVLASTPSSASLVDCYSVSSCLSAATPPLPAAVLRFALDYPTTASAVVLLCALTLLAWLLQDVREEATRALRGKRGGQQKGAHVEGALAVHPSALHDNSQRELGTTAAGHTTADTGDWRLQQQQQQQQQQRSSSPSQQLQQQQQHSAQHVSTAARHRSLHESDRDKDREWRGYDRHDRTDRDRDREQPRRRSRYELENDEDGGGYSAYRAERDREERERIGSRESYREKEVRRRQRDRDGHSSAQYSNGEGRPSLSPTHPTHPSHPSLSLPSPGHRHHQSFSSLHSHVPPSPSQASLYTTEPSSSSSVYEASVSSLPSASMLSSAASFSQLSSPSHHSDFAHRPSPFTASSSSPSVVVIGEGDFLWTLASGCELVKYGHYGSPHVRWFQIEVLHGVCRLSWGERRSGGGAGGHHALNLTKSIKLDDILDVRPGKQTSVFKQSRNDKIATDEQCCFSIITQKRSLDLQAKDRQQRDEWVNGLRQTLTDRQHGNQQQKLIVAAMAAQQQQQLIQQQQQHSNNNISAPQQAQLHL